MKLAGERVRRGRGLGHNMCCSATGGVERTRRGVTHPRRWYVALSQMRPVSLCLADGAMMMKCCASEENTPSELMALMRAVTFFCGIEV
jgi:hypothetical protein